jgi:hypothetical protein
MVISVRALLALFYNYFKLFSCICNLDSIDNFFFNSLFLTIVYIYIAFSLFCDVSLLIFNYLFIIRRLVPFQILRFRLFPFF